MNKTSFQLSNFGLLFVFTMTSVGSGSYKLAKLVSNHIYLLHIPEHACGRHELQLYVLRRTGKLSNVSDQVLDNLFLPTAAFIASTFFSKLASANGPFFSDLAIVVLLLNLI